MDKENNITDDDWKMALTSMKPVAPMLHQSPPVPEGFTRFTAFLHEEFKIEVTGFKHLSVRDDFWDCCFESMEAHTRNLKGPKNFLLKIILTLHFVDFDDFERIKTILLLEWLAKYSQIEFAFTDVDILRAAEFGLLLNINKYVADFKFKPHPSWEEWRKDVDTLRILIKPA